jgi:hypothetical protein
MRPVHLKKQDFPEVVIGVISAKDEFTRKRGCSKMYWRQRDLTICRVL